MERRKKGPRLGVVSGSLAALGFLAFLWGGPAYLHSRGQKAAKRTALRVYESARSGYRGAPLSDHARATLLEWDTHRGRPTGWCVVQVVAQALGSPSHAFVEVTRRGVAFREDLFLPEGDWVAFANEARR